jgi:hypothetical protein
MGFPIVFHHIYISHTSPSCKPPSHFYGDFAIIAQVLGIEAARRTIMQEIKVTSPGDPLIPVDAGAG